MHNTAGGDVSIDFRREGGRRDGGRGDENGPTVSSDRCSFILRETFLGDVVAIFSSRIERWL
jgi:hypothetical protein